MTENPAPYHVAPSPTPDKPDTPDFQQGLAALQGLYPQCFPTDDAALKPLKIGIHKDLLARDLPEGVSATQLRAFLSWYTRHFQYRKALKAGAVRSDLEGNPAGVVTEEQSQFASSRLKPKAKHPPPDNTRNHLPSDAPLTEDSIVPGRLELTIKFNELPKPVQVQAGYKFGLDCGDRRVSVTLKPKVWNKLAAAAAEYPQWVAALTGKMGPREGSGFVLLEPALQVFEKKPKVQQGAETRAPETTAETTPPPAASTPPPATPEPAAAQPAAEAEPAAPKKPKLSLKR